MGGFEIVLILAFILISVLDGMARSRKRKMGGAPPKGGASRTTRPLPRARRRVEAGAEAETSEGLISADVWEEIAGLIRGELPGPPDHRPEPSSEPSLSTGARGSSRERVVPPDAEAELEAAGWGAAPELPSWGKGRSPWTAGGATPEEAAREPTLIPLPQASTPPTTPPAMGGPERALSLRGAEGVVAARVRQEDERDAAYAAEGGTPAAGQLRLSLVGGERGRLREAVVLREVLGPPLSLRDADDGIVR